MPCSPKTDSGVTPSRAVRSRDCVAISHLLRSLDLPGRLRQNELVARCFAGVREVGDAELDGRMIALRIKAIVLASIASLENDAVSAAHGSRQRSIMERCDVRREKHSAVAASLGISLREFYRERRRAMERLADLVRTELARPSEAVLRMPGTFDLDLDRVVNLTRVGDMPAAFRLLDSVVRAATSVRDRVRACCLGVELAADRGDAARGREFLAVARRTGASLGETHDALIVLIELDLARAMQSWAVSDLTATRAACDRAARGADGISAFGEPEASRLAVTALLRSATFALAVEEDSDFALKRLGEARRILDRMAHKPPDLSGELLISLGLTQWYVDGRMAQSLAYLREAVAILANGQVAGLLPVALRYLCESFVMVGDVPEGRTAGGCAMHGAKSIGSVQIWVYACLSMAAIELASGNAKNALELYYLGYDSKGNLYVDGLNYGGFNFEFGELRKGGGQINPILLPQTIRFPGGIQWDGQYVAVGDNAGAVIYQFTFSGSTATLEGQTPLTGAGNVGQFGIMGSSVVTPNQFFSSSGVLVFPYPGGGAATKTITKGVFYPFSAVVIAASSRS